MNNKNEANQKLAQFSQKQKSPTIKIVKRNVRPIRRVFPRNFPPRRIFSILSKSPKFIPKPSSKGMDRSGVTVRSPRENWIDSFCVAADVRKRTEEEMKHVSRKKWPSTWREKGWPSILSKWSFWFVIFSTGVPGTMGSKYYAFLYELNDA